MKIIKIGGTIIDNEVQLQQALNWFAEIPPPKILVHGGGSAASAFSQRLGIEAKLVGGRRITDLDSLQVVQMVYAGLINKNIVAKLQALHCPAIGLSGADANSILAEKRPVKEIDYGYVGDVSRINAAAIKKLTENGFVPVFCALTHDGKGQMLNTNADTIAAELAAGMAGLYETHLYFCFEKSGVLQNIDNAASVIPRIWPENYARLKSANIIADGMLPKIDNAFRALKRGVKNVYIGHYKELAALKASNTISGTRIARHNDQ